MAAGLALQAAAIGWLALILTPGVAYGPLIVPFVLAGTGMALVSAEHRDQRGQPITRSAPRD
jgi:hypothetical protein